METNELQATFRSLADTTRRQILVQLSSGGLSVAELATGFDMSRPAVSKHLRVLRESGLVVERKEGRQRIYRLRSGGLGSAAVWIDEVVSAEVGPSQPGSVEASDRKRLEEIRPAIGSAGRPARRRGPTAKPTQEEGGGSEPWRAW